MENASENMQQPVRDPNQPLFVPAGASRRNLLREDTRYKYPVLASVLSLMPGLGQVYVGYYQQGFINIVVVAGVISLLNYHHGPWALEPFLGLFLAFYWLYNIVDAYRRATFYNQALAGLVDSGILEADQLPGKRGTLIGGLLLIVIGGIALGYTRFGIPLDWLEDWWPVAPILIGAWLIYQSIANRRKQQKGS